MFLVIGRGNKSTQLGYGNIIQSIIYQNSSLNRNVLMESLLVRYGRRFICLIVLENIIKIEILYVTFKVDSLVRDDVIWKIKENLVGAW